MGGINNMEPRNVYRADLREFRYLLLEKYDVIRMLRTLDPETEFTQDIIESILSTAYEFATERLGPYYQLSDREGCSMNEDGTVCVPLGFRDVWEDYLSAGWDKMSTPKMYGGIGAPYILAIAVSELFLGANPALMSYHGFCPATFILLEQYGDSELKRLFSKNLITQRWAAAFCMTESDAGTDVGNIRTCAVKQDSGLYQIEGTKIFITAGMHDLSENIVYVVLARVKGAPPGTRGLSCFIVPRFLPDGNGGIAGDNHVRCLNIEEKMGLHGCATTHLVFGESGETVGYLLGGRENIGLLHVLSIMNLARMATGIYAVGLSSSAFLNALDYAKQRIQGVDDLKSPFAPNPQRVPIIEHYDVRRMLLEMKSKVEGCRAMIFKLAYHLSIFIHLRMRQDAADKPEIARQEEMIGLLTPLVKAYSSDQAWRVCELAIQVLGGYGYTKDYPVEQYARDVKILSIWEGTNYIQALDLFRIKLSLGGNEKVFKLYCDEIEDSIHKAAADNALSSDCTCLAKALDRVRESLVVMHTWAREKKTALVYPVVTRFLEMMAEVMVGALLLNDARIAGEKIMGKETGLDHDFYQGKIMSARFYIRNVIPFVSARAEVIASQDETCIQTTPDMLGHSV